MTIPIIYLTEKRKFDRKLSYVFWLLAILVWVVTAFMKESFFPENYFYDSATIYDLIIHPSYGLGDIAFENTAAIYRNLGLTDRYFIIPFIGFITYMSFFIAVLNRLKIKDCSLFEFMFMFFFSEMAMVYLTTFSKDLIVLIWVSLSFFMLIKKKKGIYIWTIISLLYAYFFRTYWVLIVGFFWMFRYFFSKSKSTIVFFLIILISFLTIGVIFQSFLGVGINNYREVVNEARDDLNDNINTLIKPIIAGTNFIDQCTNAILVFVFLMFPIPLLQTLKAFYVIITFFIAQMYYYFWRSFFSEYKLKRNINIQNVICLILSFIFIQSIFEPDYGSYVRHLSPLYPLFFYIILMRKSNLNTTATNG